MLDDTTEIRHAKHDKELWKAAAAVKKRKLSAWMRDVLTEQAMHTVASLSQPRSIP